MVRGLLSHPDHHFFVCVAPDAARLLYCSGENEYEA